MSDLDDRLREIPIDRDGGRYHLSSAELIWVKQAFADEGYERLGHHTTKKPGQKAELIMTGQEWYDRFEKEMDEAKRWTSMNGAIVMSPNVAIEAAKRAAGIE